jgi:superkiller protein 3
LCHYIEVNMSANAALKDARKALDAKDWAAALKYAQQALELDKNNYNAFIFSGLAQYNLGQVQKGEQAYIQATQILLHGRCVVGKNNHK